jgi:hypothetical protein
MHLLYITTQVSNRMGLLFPLTFLFVPNDALCSLNFSLLYRSQNQFQLSSVVLWLLLLLLLW